MKTDITSISIPQPCHEKWNEMTPGADGRFCGSCAKTVIDFSAMSADQIIGYLAMSQNACGRFGADQLRMVNARLNVEDAPEQSFWKRLALGISMLTLTQQATKAQTEPAPPPTEQTQVSFILGKVKAPEPDTTKTRVIRGRVIDSVEKFPLPGATISVNGKAIVASNVKGEFELRIPRYGTQLTVKYIGYAEERVSINDGDSTPFINVILKERIPDLMGAVVVIKPPLHKRLYYRLIKRPIKKIFG